ncbi:FAD-dependent oxidoreductase [Aureibacillus halotolerans]|uniref:NADPH-dependent 2,4-dienoyl-CoA reductase/sulfur reductase-like enzyme n=1 Tax=Aureibacillus halotolerans TaxID=1508390 RepID=A0A4R6TYS2_9BACI|nr:FAD-dependent oxidoreductase [Aureibacillus halotolerans]TDQ38751.1 NADPH-dependent 2,4-dienoyl-CoA reductase/sulfur reductase-like enzyme [Aureibacillus halotolerans]
MHFVIIGGDAAGMSAAMQIVRTKDSPRITVLEKGTVFSYGQCGLPYFIGGHLTSSDDLIARSREDFENKYGIDTRVLYDVQKVDTHEKLVMGMDYGNNQPFSISYDVLLVASGASPKIPDWPGTNLKGVHTIKTVPEAERIYEQLPDIEHVVVIGGGYVGLEAAENFKEQGKHVTIIQRSNQLAPMLDEDLAELALKEAEANGVNVVLNATVEGLEGSSKVHHVMTSKGRYAADLVIIAAGITPNTSFLPNDTFHKARNGAVLVDAYMRTNVENVFAAGDCATHYNIVKRTQDYMPLGTTANKQGQIAGQNMAGLSRAFKGITGTSILRFFGLEIAKTGLSGAECEALDFPYKVTEANATDIASYFTNREKMTIRLFYHADNQKLLGGQIIGRHGVDKRIDVLSVALFHGMCLKDLEDLDLSYAPPFNSVWDPLQQVARRTKT